MLHKLSRGGHRASSEPTDDDNTPPVSPIDANPGSELPVPSRTIVSIDILPENYGYSYSSPIGQSEPRPIRVIDPTVTFTSRSSMMAYSSFTVFLDGKCVHTEVADLKLNTTNISSEVDCVFFYSTTLVPRFWDQLCDCQGRSRSCASRKISDRGFRRSHEVYNHARHRAAQRAV